jgi:hypothetical protein
MSELARVLAAAGPITGTATGDDGAVTVEVELGGKLRAVKLTPRALRYGARYLADTVVSVAATATARASRRAAQLYAQALGPRAEEYLSRLGLSYDPALLGDATPERATPQRRARVAEEDDPFDYPETWMRRR